MSAYDHSGGTDRSSKRNTSCSHMKYVLFIHVLQTRAHIFLSIHSFILNQHLFLCLEILQGIIASQWLHSEWQSQCARQHQFGALTAIHDADGGEGTRVQITYLKRVGVKHGHTHAKNPSNNSKRTTMMQVSKIG